MLQQLLAKFTNLCVPSQGVVVIFAHKAIAWLCTRRKCMLPASKHLLQYMEVILRRGSCAEVQVTQARGKAHESEYGFKNCNKGNDKQVIRPEATVDTRIYQHFPFPWHCESKKPIFPFCCRRVHPIFACWKNEWGPFQPAKIETRMVKPNSTDQMVISTP